MIKYEAPPFYRIIKKAFPHADIKTQIFAFYPHIYTSVPLSKDLVAHEETHLRQQESFFRAILWWKKYIKDPKFRVEMEVEACIEQLKMARTIASKDKVAQLMVKMAKNLSSEVYNSPISYKEALKRIQ